MLKLLLGGYVREGPAACRERKVLEGEARQMQEDMQALVEADLEAQQVY